jgi:DNA-binding NarL/FixJ family response regulator
VLEHEFDVVAVVHDGYALLGAAQALVPDVIVTDIAMPGVDGVTALARIKGTHPEIRVVVITVHNDPALVQRAFEAGATGYVLKLAAGEDLPTAVKTVLAGGQYVSPQVNGQSQVGQP